MDSMEPPGAPAPQPPLRWPPAPWRPAGPPSGAKIGEGANPLARRAVVRCFRELYPAAIAELRAGADPRAWAARWHVWDTWLISALLLDEDALPPLVMEMSFDPEAEPARRADAALRREAARIVQAFVAARVQAAAEVADPEFVRGIRWTLRNTIERRSYLAIADDEDSGGKYSAVHHETVRRAVERVSRLAGLTLVPLRPGRRTNPR